MLAVSRKDGTQLFFVVLFRIVFTLFFAVSFCHRLPRTVLIFLIAFVLPNYLPRQRNYRLDQIERDRDADDDRKLDEQILPPIRPEVAERGC